MTDALSPPPDAVPPASIRPRRGRRIVGHATVWLLTLALVALAVDQGLRLRQWTWDFTAPIHFRGDITRGYGWGFASSGDEGYLNQYEKMARQNHWLLYLDYAPLRLAVMTRWAAHNRATAANVSEWRPDYAFNRPVLFFNTAMEGVGVLAAFFLVRKVVRDGDRRPPARSWAREWIDRLRRRPRDNEPLAIVPPSPFRGWAHGLAAAAMLWFNPAMILSAHSWPTWDIWIVPMFLLAVLAGVYGRWTWAGVAIGVGAMLKGQLFVGMPVFFAWTLLNGDWRGAVRFAAGLVISIAVVASPWLLTLVPPATLDAFYAGQPLPTDAMPQDYVLPALVRAWNGPAIGWAVGVAVVAGALPFVFRTRRPSAVWTGLALAAAFVLWPLAVRFEAKSAELLVPAFGLISLAAVFVRRWPDRVIVVLTATAAALLAGMHFFHSSSAWWTCGIAFGTDHWRAMVMGAANNLPALLDTRYGWHSIEDVVFTLDWPARFKLASGPVDVTMRVFTRGLMVLATLPCLWAVARHARRHDRRLLIAVTAPWLVFVCLPTEIHERYLIYPAAIGMIWVGQSVGMALLATLLTLVTMVQQLHVMLISSGRVGEFGEVLHAWQPRWFDATAGDTLLKNLAATFPDLAWAVLLAMLVVLYVGVVRTSRFDQCCFRRSALGGTVCTQAVSSSGKDTA